MTLGIFQMESDDPSYTSDPDLESGGSAEKRRRSWKGHRVDGAEGGYACDQCDKVFGKQSSLARHKYEHSGRC